VTVVESRVITGGVDTHAGTHVAAALDCIGVFDFELTTAELKGLDALDSGVRSGPEPDDITLQACGRPIPEA
jgi:hypothetical protein